MSLPDQIDELCDAWADQWELHSCPDLKQFLEETNPELLNAALSVLIPMDFSLRRSKRPALEASEYQWLGDDAVAIAERWRVRSVVSDSSEAGQKADSAARNGFWQFQSECDEPNTDRRQDDAHAPELSDFPAQVGEYRVVELIGGGGQGVVAKAVHERTGRAAAVKFIRPELAASLPVRRRFLRESSIARSIRHPNVVQFLSIEEKPQLCIVMEFVNGKTLDTLVSEHGTLPFSQLLSIGVQIADGLQAVHSANIVHRDLKPMNILLETGDSLSVRISDFGVARFSGDPGITRSGTIVGSAAWLSPEQALEKPVSLKSDLFSFGSILYCMACGQSPFLRPTLMATLNAIVHDVPVGVKVILPELPDEFSRLLDALLAKEPTARPSSAREVAERLRSIQGMPKMGPAEVHCASAENVEAVREPLRIGRRALLSGMGVVACASLVRKIQSLLSGETNSPPEGELRQSTLRRIHSDTAPAALVVPSTLSDVQHRQTIWATHLGVPTEFDAGEGIRFALVPPIQLSPQLQSEMREELWSLTKLAGEGVADRLRDGVFSASTSPFFAATQPLTWRQYRILCDGVLAGSLLARLSVADHNGTSDRNSAEMIAEVTWKQAMELQSKFGQQTFLRKKLESIRGVFPEGVKPVIGLPRPIEWLVLARLLHVADGLQLTRVNIARQIQLMSQSVITSGVTNAASFVEKIGLFELGQNTRQIRGWIDHGRQNNDVIPGVAGMISFVEESRAVRCTWSISSEPAATSGGMLWPIIQVPSSRIDP